VLGNSSYNPTGIGPARRRANVDGIVQSGNNGSAVGRRRHVAGVPGCQRAYTNVPNATSPYRTPSAASELSHTLEESYRISQTSKLPGDELHPSMVEGAFLNAVAGPACPVTTVDNRSGCNCSYWPAIWATFCGKVLAQQGVTGR
jgi:hypothetical protein